jgi:hypothetical protein
MTTKLKSLVTEKNQRILELEAKKAEENAEELRNKIFAALEERVSNCSHLIYTLCLSFAFDGTRYHVFENAVNLSDALVITEDFDALNSFFQYLDAEGWSLDTSTDKCLRYYITFNQ